MFLRTIYSIVIILTPLNHSFGNEMKKNKAYFYLGTYTRHLSADDKKFHGISRWSVNIETGIFTKIGGEWPIEDSSHLCMSQDEKYLYSITEGSTFRGKKDGYLTVFSVKDDGNLEEIQKISSQGVGPAYVHLDRSGSYLFLANYLAGNVVVYPIKKNGLLGKPTDNKMHTGSSINSERQKQPHPHAIIPSPDNEFVFVPDLGTDKIHTYKFDSTNGTLTVRDELNVKVKPGSGPRHFIFHPTGKYAYMTLELSGQVAAYEYKSGKLISIETYDLVEKNETSQSAEIRIHPDGNFLYASNRIHNSITGFEINKSTGELKKIQVISTNGHTPRNFNIDPSGSCLVVGNKDSNTMISFKIDKESGEIESFNNIEKTNSPVLFYFQKP